ncbi:hypothetical protein [Actinophytocola oryzae]|uniref:Heavy-metal-associated domain-containing protein n=1 Tax=Actinophytocola oryzae TaxID=502181 RepID=A0A4R7VUG8_9PSEU|nr:hypothetical protein [Actinophytocola oryzae]TDV53606.1 hypothetical protein CLV71_10474 [Actinophytocola oryzae]
MKTLTKLGAFALALVLVFGSAYVVGRIVGPPPAAAAPVAAEVEPAASGLEVVGESMQIKVLTDSVQAGVPVTFAFQILQYDGTPLMKYKPQHDKLLHMIVARRDLTNFQHVHPNLGPDGVWRVPLTFAEAGEYKVFADFFPLWGIHNSVVAQDISVAGNFQPHALPAPSNTTTVDGYTATMKGTLTAGKMGNLKISIAKDGKPVTDLEPYLAAYGHLVVLRDGDLAYLHVHPTGTPGDGRTKPGPDIDFMATPPTYGAYRFFLDFQHGGVVHTAVFTVNVGGKNPPPHGLDEATYEAIKAANEKAALSGGTPAAAGGSSGGTSHGH